MWCPNFWRGPFQKREHCIGHSGALAGSWLRFLGFGCEGTQLPLLSQDPQQVENKWDVIIASPQVVIVPPLELMLLALQPAP